MHSEYMLFIVYLLLGSTTCADLHLLCDEVGMDFDRDNLGEIVPYCTVTSFRVTHSQNVVINKMHGGNSIKFMKFYDSTLLYVPFHLFDTFTNLKTLDVSYTSILELTRNTFAAASNLTYLNLSNNNLTNIGTSVFVGAHSLMRLDLTANEISSLSENAFCGLRSLNKLQLSHNQLSEIEKDIFKDNEYLESISLEHNKLEYIDAAVFNRLRRLQEVNLSANRLQHLDPDIFHEALNLESVLLAQNRLSEFHLTNKSITHQLKLDSNNLTSLTINATRFVRANYNNISALYLYQALQLETLDLKSNNISDITNITQLSSLLHLDLSHNPIGRINITTFDRLKRLRDLYLRGTGLQRLAFGMFSKQTYLEILDLSFNNLTQLNVDIFVPYLAGLKQFFIDGNNLTEIEGRRTFTYAFQNLQKLGISRNRFNCSYLHHLLIPPNLSGSVLLHIEPDDSIEESSHIRDVSCVSHVNESLQHARKELHEMTELQLHLKLSMDLLRAHEQRLEMYFLVMKIFFVGTVTMILGLTVFRLWKRRRTGRYERSSIVFQSNATSDSSMPA